MKRLTLVGLLASLGGITALATITIMNVGTAEAQGGWKAVTEDLQKQITDIVNGVTTVGNADKLDGLDSTDFNERLDAIEAKLGPTSTLKITTDAPDGPEVPHTLTLEFNQHFAETDIHAFAISMSSTYQVAGTGFAIAPWFYGTNLCTGGLAKPLNDLIICNFDPRIDDPAGNVPVKFTITNLVADGPNVDGTTIFVRTHSFSTGSGVLGARIAHWEGIVTYP